MLLSSPTFKCAASRVRRSELVDRWQVSVIGVGCGGGGQPEWAGVKADRVDDKVAPSMDGWTGGRGYIATCKVTHKSASGNKRLEGRRSNGRIVGVGVGIGVDACLAGWLAGWLPAWLAGWLPGWLAGWLGRCVGRSFVRYGRSQALRSRSRNYAELSATSQT